MRILMHDYAGHPFQVQLSRTLAQRGHRVLHLYAEFFQTPRGSLKKLVSDPDNFACRALNISRPFEKYSFFRRRFQEIEYGKVISREVEDFQPEVVISANMPLDPQKILLKKCKANKIKFIFWLQDMYGIAIKKLLSKRYSLLGRMIGTYYRWLDFQMLRNSDHVVAITEDFVPLLEGQRVQHEKIHVIHNWAPLEEIPMQSKDNKWAKEYGLHDKFCILYSGTLSLKHNPDLLLGLAKAMDGRDDVRIVVISEGMGANYLKKKKEQMKLENLILMDFQPFEAMPQLLAAADILVAILEEDSGIFSVPSKVLTYHCAGRPLLLAVPADNLAARIVKDHETGLVVSPNDVGRFIQMAVKLVNDKEMRGVYGENARRYAEKTFDIAIITDNFERIIAC